MIKTISHLADIHIANDPKKSDVQKSVVETTLQSLRDKKSDRIVIVGDLFHNFLKPTNESKKLAAYFLNECSKIAKTIIIRGNHDFNAKSNDRLDSVQTIVDILNNDKITYYNTTGFYNDDNVVWVVWFHGEKVSPWVKFPDHVRDETKTYIDLFHDPINGSKTFFGQEFKDSHYVSLNDFQGDLAMFGDIHQLQYFEKNNKPFAAYSSSLFQNNFGESPTDHGYLIWDIENEPSNEFIQIPNEYVYYNVYLTNKKGEIDYDNLDLSNQFKIKDFTHIKVNWSDLSSNIQQINERKIRIYFKNLVGDKLVELKFKKEKINGDTIKENDYISKSLKNIHDPNVQTEIFKTFLAEKGFDDAFINEVLTIDFLITKRLTHIHQEGSDWELLSFYLDNFKSHGDLTEIDWEKQDGIWQIKGKNGSGKTTILSLLQYVLYGRSLDVFKTEKFGDLRFINNKRNLDYCEGGVVIRIGNTKYKIVRRSERKWNRDKSEVSKVPTTLNIYRLDEDNNIITDENDEQRASTQKVVEASLGTLDDFTRHTLINGDTINNLLSLDESVFMDSLLRDSGLDIFEVKLAEYKDYKKSLYKVVEKIVIDPIKANETIEQLKENIILKENEIKLIDKQLDETKEKIKKGLLFKEEEIKKLHKVDETLRLLSIDTIKDNINKLIFEKEEKNKEIDILNQKINSLKETYNEVKYKELLVQKDSIKEAISTIKSDIQKNRNTIDTNHTKIIGFNGDVLTINKQIKINEENIENEKVNINTLVSLKNKEITNILKAIDNKISNIRDQISHLEKSKTCPTCERLLNAETIEPIKNKIKGLENDILLLENSKGDNLEISKLKSDIDILNLELVNGNDKTNVFKKKISDYHNDIEKKNSDRLVVEAEDIELKKSIEDLIEKGKTKNLTLTEVDENISLIDMDIKEVEQRSKLISQKDIIPIQIENIDLKVAKEKETYHKFEENEKKIQDNLSIEVKIEKFNDRLKDLDVEKQGFINQISVINNVEINGFKNEILTLTDRLTRFIKQEREELVNKTYVECIHRDGLPKIMLLRMRDDINNELQELLSDMDFSVYFDENMTLKMYNNVKPEAVINVISGCGMERTFISVVLRFALRNINKKTGNLLLLDEITGKLLDESVTKFFELIHKMKNHIPKIIIIEHAYSEELDPDYIIDVSVDDKGVSSMVIK